MEKNSKQIKKAEKAKDIKDIRLKEDSRLERALKQGNSEIIAKAVQDMLKRDEEQ